MMSAEKDKQEFIAEFCVCWPKRSVQEKLTAARVLLRLAATYQRLAVAHCNGPEHLVGHCTDSPERNQCNAMLRERWDTRLERDTKRCAKRIKAVCAPFKLPVKLGGDPRGYCVKVKLPSGRCNTWGDSEDGYGIPS